MEKVAWELRQKDCVIYGRGGKRVYWSRYRFDVQCDLVDRIRGTVEYMDVRELYDLLGGKGGQVYC